MIPNDQLLKQIHGRNGSCNSFGYGITTAASYVKQFAEHCGDVEGLASRLSPGGMPSLAKTVKEAEQTLVYSNSGMVIEAKASGSSFRDIIPKDAEVEIPKNTLMVFQHVVTTPSEDRDNDVLKTEGAVVDPKTVLLWQHMPTFPLGKRLLTIEHTKDVLRMVTALVDINDLTSDVAKMLEADILRISHGFRALEFNERKTKEGEMPGFEITKFEIMEISLVSVPSNVDAEVEQFANAKFTSDVMKGYADWLLKSQETGHVRGAEVPLRKTMTEEERLIIDGDPDAGKPQGILYGSDIIESASRKFFGGEDIDGSYEKTSSVLRSKSLKHLADGGVPVNVKDDWVYIVATFSDRGIICHSDSVGNEKCYESAWNNISGEPAWSGALREVEITATVRQKMLDVKDAIFKAGKVLSKTNETKLNDAVEDMTEVTKMDDISRAAKSLINGAKSKVKAVIDSAGSGDTDDGKHITTDADVLSHFMRSSSESGHRLYSKIKSILQVHDQADLVQQLDSVFSTE